MLWIWNFGFPNKGPSSLSSLITNESAFLLRFLVQSRSIGNHLFYFFVLPDGGEWLLLNRHDCSGHAVLGFVLHPSLLLILLFISTSTWSWTVVGVRTALLTVNHYLASWRLKQLDYILDYCFSADYTHDGECCWCCLCSLSLCITATNSRILDIKPIQSFLFWCSATEGTWFDFCCTSEEKGPTCLSALDLFTCTSVQPFINQWTPGCPQTYNDTFSEAMDRQKGLFWIISNFSSRIIHGTEAA